MAATANPFGFIDEATAASGVALLLYGLTQSGRFAHAADSASPDGARLCPFCGRELILRSSAAEGPSFDHRAISDCPSRQGAAQLNAQLWARNLLARSKSVRAPAIVARY